MVELRLRNEPKNLRICDLRTQKKICVPTFENTHLSQNISNFSNKCEKQGVLVKYMYVLLYRQYSMWVKIQESRQFVRSSSDANH